ncbi:MAG: hypothetical protein IJI11_03645 [Mogibacterium sp.]|nr:hypothetical protein [Mogibacterium sp.]
MHKIIRDSSLGSDARHIGIVEVHYPDKSEWDIAGFEAYKNKELEAIMADGADYDREAVFRQHPYFRYFRKFKKTYPVMMQVESFLLKGRPFPEGEYINAVAFLTELRTHILLGTHDIDRIEGDLILYNETEKTPFTGMINPDSHSYPGDVTGRDDKGIIISMIAGADNRTCIHEDTKNVIYLIFGVAGMTDEEMENVADTIIQGAKALAPAAKAAYSRY